MNVANIGPSERRKRTVLGLFALAVGAVLVVTLVGLGAGAGWQLLAFPPFFMGALGIMQARRHT
jgi:hypothetical protein